MSMQDDLHLNLGASEAGSSPRQPRNAPGLRWIAAWTLLTTAAIPAAMVAGPPLVVFFQWLFGLGVKAGWWAAAGLDNFSAPGFLAGFAVSLAVVQSILLRRYLPRPGQWFLATAAGILLSGLAAWLILARISTPPSEPMWIFAAGMLLLGLFLGLSQWLYLRRFLPNAFWIIAIDILAAGSLLLAGKSFTSLGELLLFVMPGLITGAGLALLLSQPGSAVLPAVQKHTTRESQRRVPRLAWVGMAALVPLFFACSWVYAVSQLTLAKNEGVYPTVEEAVIGHLSQDWGGARVVRVDNIHTGPNRGDGSQPHVWFGTATVYMDRAPQGYDWDHYSAGSFYLRVKDGWVYLSEGSMPGFIGWVMELYGLEGVGK